MTLRASKPAFNVREKLTELGRRFGLKGSELAAAETAQEARDFISAGRKNLVINGGMDVWQRGTSFSNPASGGYTADRWKCSTDPTDISRSTDVPSGEPFTYSMLMAANGSGGTRHAALQGVELTATGNAGPFKVGTTWTFSCWMKGGANGSILFGTDFRDDPNSGTNAVTISSTTFNYTTSWQKFTHTFTVGVSPGGTNLCLAIIFFAATAPANNLYLTGCQLEKGKNATEFEHRSIGEELALCQRYCQRLGPDDGTTTSHYNSFASGWLRSGSILSYSLQTQTDLPVRMRTIPSASVGGGTNTFYAQYGGTAITCSFSNLNTQGSTPQKVWIDFQPSSTAGTDGLRVVVGSDNSSGGQANYIILSAEL